ncbi:hypothetical protein IF1G_06269 [Cordyceps javanica]|uniref:Nephrocystin 3-like N-terminal domain-containing protein n=1 Tax=Cordyceps javanica TaxID=43265 RepID=A0A545VUW8_9HYPO|nr:hypothetical protein IF1G_06269 [Cordyceps javanica]TQW05521.1 AAA ATPase domain-containing protein [Cordyceps javanica]
MDGISSASAVFSLVELAGKTVSYIKQVKAAPQEKEQLLRLVIQSKGLLLTLGELIESIEDESWASTICNLASPDGPFAQYEVILKQIASRLDVRGDGSKIQRIMDRLKWPFSHKEVEEMMTVLEKLKSLFLLATASSHVRLSMETRKEVEKTNRTLHDIKAVLTTHFMSLTPRQKAMVESLSSIDLSNRLDESEINSLTKTCGWFLEHEAFRSWESGKASLNALAVVSGPGTGKSTLCEVVQYYLQLWLDAKPDCIVVHLPLRLQVRPQMNKASLLSKIVSQILLACPQLITHLLTLRRPHGVLPFDVGIKLLQTARADLEQLYIIIDGLDEADDEELQHGQFSTLRTGLRATSIHEPQTGTKTF